MSDQESDDFDLEEMLEGSRPEVAATLRRWFKEADEDRAKRERGRRLQELARARARRRARGDPFAVVGASPPLGVRLPRWLDEQLRIEFQTLGVSPSEGLRQILEEWWVTRKYPTLEYRAPAFLRTADVREGPSLSEWRQGGSVEPLPSAAKEQALDYVTLFAWRFDPLPAARGR
ncbi:MAG TPA: hypothetical protein VF039_02695 [Longimicrobiales bacterium]